MSASPFTDIASRDARLKRLFAAVRLNQRATAVMQGALPPGLAGLFRVVRIEQGEVLVYARNGGAATKLRLLADHLIHALRQRGLDVGALRVKVHVDEPEPPRPAKQIALTPHARESLSRAAAQIGSPALRAAMERLAHASD